MFATEREARAYTIFTNEGRLLPLTLLRRGDGQPTGKPLEAADVIGRAIVTALFVAMIAAVAAGSALLCAAVLARV